MYIHLVVCLPTMALILGRLDIIIEKKQNSEAESTLGFCVQQRSNERRSATVRDESHEDSHGAQADYNAF